MHTYVNSNYNVGSKQNTPELQLHQFGRSCFFEHHQQQSASESIENAIQVRYLDINIKSPSTPKL